MADVSDGSMDEPKHRQDKRRLMVTQLLRSPVLNPAGTEVGRVEDFIVKLSDGAYPPVTGLKVRVGAQGVFIGKDLIESLEPGAVRLNTHTIRTDAFQRRPGEVLLADFPRPSGMTPGKTLSHTVDRQLNGATAIRETVS